MSTDIKIPDEAICHIRGQPMNVVRSGERARALGLKVPGGDITTIQCHGYCLTIENEDVAQETIKLLDAYHASSIKGDQNEPIMVNGLDHAAGAAIPSQLS